jgi:hypothetical protein
MIMVLMMMMMIIIIIIIIIYYRTIYSYILVCKYKSRSGENILKYWNE